MMAVRSQHAEVADQNVAIIPLRPVGAAIAMRCSSCRGSRGIAREVYKVRAPTTTSAWARVQTDPFDPI